jgi:flap endonuclease-1
MIYLLLYNIMGIHNLNKFLKKNCPKVFNEVHISEYGFKKVAIDTSLYLCKFKAVYGDKWISAFINLIASLRKNEVHCVFVYDSGSPPEKQAEKDSRLESRQKLQHKIDELEDAMKLYHSTNEISPVLSQFYGKKMKKVSPTRVLLSSKPEKIDMKLVEEWISKTKNQILNITSEDFQMTKELFKILNVPILNAPLEAEKFCSDLCRKGLVDAVLSEDTDVLAYGSPKFLSKIDTTKETYIEINYEYMLEELNLSKEQFLDLCIMCGCDYNKNIYKVGPEKAYLYLKKHSSIENIESNLKLDISVLNHVRTRELFTNFEVVEDIKIPYCGRPDFNVLIKFIKDHNIVINMEYIKKSFDPKITILE